MEDDQDQDDVKTLAMSVSTKLSSRKLSTRIEAVEDDAMALFTQGFQGKVKVGPLKRVAREIVMSLVSGPSLCVANRGEKAWPSALRAFVSTVSNEQIEQRVELPFHFVSYCAEVLSGKVETTRPYEIETLLQLSDAAVLLLSEVHDVSNNDDIQGCPELIAVLSVALNKVATLCGSSQPASRESKAALTALHKLTILISEMLVQYPKMLPLFLDAWIAPLLPVSSPSSTLQLCLPGLAVLHHASSNFPLSGMAVALSQILPLRPALIAALTLVISGGSVLPTSVTSTQGKAAISAASTTGALVCFRSVLATINPDEWSELESQLVRQLKKNPETSAVLVATVCDSVPVGLDNLLREGLGLVLPRLLRSAAIEVQQAGLNLVQLAAQRCCDSGADSALVLMTLSLCEALNGKPISAGGRLCSPSGGGFILTLDSQKTAIIQAFGSCVAVMSNFLGSQRGEGTQIVIDAAVEALLLAISKEKEPAVKYHEASLTARWLLCQSSLPAKTITAFVSGLAIKASAGPYLLILSSLFSAPLSGNVSEYARAIADSTPLVTCLVKTVTDAQMKPQVASPEAVLALRVLLEVHALASLPESIHQTVTTCLLRALPVNASQADESFLLALALHSQIVGRSSSISSTNNCPLGHSTLEAIMAVVGIAHRDYATSVPLFVPLKDTNSVDGEGDGALESKEEETTESSGLGHGFGVAARKLIIFSAVSLRESNLRKRVCSYWVPSLLRACTAYSASQPGSKRTSSVHFCGSLSLLDELNAQVRGGAEHKERVRSEELTHFKGKESGSGAVISATMDSSVSLFLQTPSSRLRETLFYFLPPPAGSVVEVSDTVSAQVFSLSVLLSAHPMLSNDSLIRNTQIYRRIVSDYLRLPNESSSLPADVLQSLNASVAQGVFATQSANANRRAGGQVALLLYDPSSLLPGEVGRELVLKVILPKLAEELHSDAISHFSHEEEQVWKNPEYLMQEVERSITTGAGIDDLKITNADRKKSSARGSRRGQFGSDFNEDEEWAEQLMKDKRDKKLKGAHEAAQSSPEMTKAVEKTAGIQTRVGAVLRRSEAALDLLEFLASKYCDAFESMTIILLTPLLELLRSPLVHDKALSTTHALIGALVHRTALDRAKLDIGLSLELVATVILRPTSSGHDNSEGIFKEVSECSGPIMRTLRVLHMLAAQASSASKNVGKSNVTVISTGCFQLVFPILRGVLSLRSQLPGGEHAFMILENLWKHVNRTTESSLLCRSLLRYMLEATLGVASRSARLTGPAGEFLMSLVSVTLSPLEWTPLIGASGLLCSEVSVRRLAIAAVMLLAKKEQELIVSGEGVSASRRMCNQPLVVSRIWLSGQDEDEEVKTAATEVWLLTGMTLSTSFMTPLLPLLEKTTTTDTMKQTAANALAAGMKVHPDLGGACLSTLKAIYTEALPQLPQSATALAIPKLSSESSVGSAKSSNSGGASSDLSIGAIRSSLSGGRNKVASSKKSSGAIDMSMIGMGAKKAPVKKSGGIGAGIGIGIGIGSKPVAKKQVAKEHTPSVTEQLSRIEKVVEDHKWPLRVVIANCYWSIGTTAAFSPEMNEDLNHTTELLTDAFQFLLTDGVTDPREEVRAKMVTAGRAVIDTYGKDNCDVIVELLKATLAEQQPNDKQELIKFDLRHEATVILLGAAAKHLNKDDPNVKSIMESLVSSLSTPVESVQKAVADCLVPLVQARKTEDRVKEIIEELMTQVVDGDSYGARRGAAFGLSAFVKGSGIPAIKNHDLVSRLKEFASSGSNNQRQGALFAFELLSDRLGMLFEPYVITIVPLLLKSFSHPSDHVREAAQLGAKTIMGRLSSHGVKQVLTPILQSLPTETQWKSRQEALRLLGSMAFCAPRQLASCLPQVIPRLVEAGSDPHPKVKEGAKSALSDISSVIRNPEVSRLSPILLKALTDPATQTKAALEALLECEFMHSIDAPSLALLVPILARALKDRGGDLKRKSAVILGNMASMIADSKILSPYLPQVIPGLKDVLLDPIPDVRATSAKALGGLMLGMGETELPDLVQWCLASLSIETSPVERSGAAQGLAEICLALSADRVEDILDEALRLQDSSSSASREGLLWLLAFLPAVMEEDFADHISVTLPVVLKGLSDNIEGVREVAMRSGQVFVSCHGRNHSDEVLPPLLTGMFHSDWRIRESSVMLLGELLYLIGEAKAVGLSTREADGGEIAEGGYLGSLSRVVTTIREHVGQVMADDILSSLYIARSDNSVSVRQCALQVWKSVIANTPRVLREIMPTLVQQIISMLSSSGDGSDSAAGDVFEPDFEDDMGVGDDDYTPEVAVKSGKASSGASEQSTVAGRALGELVRKLGDHVLPLIIPYLQDGLSNTTDHLRQGVCLGLSEILKAASAKQITAYIDTLVPALQQAISDSSSHVRTLAAQAFHALARAIGHQAFDSVLPPLLKNISEDYDKCGASTTEEDNSYALMGLEDIASHRPRDLLEYVIPLLLEAPLLAWAAHTLGRLARCANKNIHHHFSTLIPQLIFELGTTSFNIDQLEAAGESCDHESARLEAIKVCAGAVVGSSTTAGINFLVGELGKQIEQAALEAHSSSVVVTSSTTISPIACRRWGCWLLGQFFVNATTNGSSEDIADYGEYIPLFLKYLLARSADMDTETLKAIVEALKSLAKSVPVEILVTHVDFIRSCINLTASDAKHRVNKQDKERLYDPVTGQFILPLFRIPKALENLFPIFIHALMNGSVEARETAATCIGELAIMTETPLLKPYLIKTTGPLIRVVGDRFPSNVKFAILETLSILLQKGGIGLKAFVPQLQTTFVKSLSDPSKQVRTRASSCLGILVPMSARIDPLLSELSLGVQGAESSAICVSFAEGISSVLNAAGGKASEEVLEKISRALLVSTVSEDEQVRMASAQTLGTLTQLYTSSRQVSNLLLDLMPPGGRGGSLAASGEHWTSTAGRLISCGEVLHNAADLGEDMQSEVLDLFQQAFSDDRVSIRVAVCSAVASVAIRLSAVDAASQQQLCVAVLERFGNTLAIAATKTGLADDSLEVRRAAVGAIKQLAKYSQPLCANFAGAFACALQPYVVPNAEINIRLKKGAERALKYLLGIRHYQGAKSEACVITATAASSAAAMQNISATSADIGRFMHEYAQRVLSKLGEESDGADW